MAVFNNRNTLRHEQCGIHICIGNSRANLPRPVYLPALSCMYWGWPPSVSIHSLCCCTGEYNMSVCLSWPIPIHPLYSNMISSRPNQAWSSNMPTCLFTFCHTLREQSGDTQTVAETTGTPALTGHSTNIYPHPSVSVYFIYNYNVAKSHRGPIGNVCNYIAQNK